jgi:hypothetical protein
MQRLDPDLLTHILHCMLSNNALLTPAHLRALNSLKAVSSAWSAVIRRLLKQYASTRAMLEVFREDCEHHFPLTLPVRCRMNPYASSHGLTVLSVLDDFHVLDRCVEAVIHDLLIETLPCADVDDARFSPCPCTWHFEEVLDDAHDPSLCLSNLRIAHVRLEVAGTHFTCIKQVLATEFSPTEIEHATDRGLCTQDSLLLACMHLGQTFTSTWLSVGLLRVLRSLQDTRKNSVLTFIATETQAH